MRKRALLMAVGPLLYFVACGGGGNSTVGGSVDAQVQGNWFAILTSTSISGSHTTVDVFIKQQGTTINAFPVQAYNQGGSWCVQGVGDMAGSVSGNNVTLTIHVSTELELKLTGNLSNGILSGTYTTIGSCANGDAGTFTAQLYPSITSNSWAGVASFAGASVDLTGNLSEDSAGNLTGSIAFSTFPCVATINVGGIHVGRLVSFSDSNGIILDFIGSIDANGKTISGEEFLGSESVCGFETLTMTRP